jgi:hypothetical protein
MTEAKTIQDIREQWNNVLDFVEREDRITWMAFFDARLDSFDGEILILDYSDSQKFGGSHQFPETRAKQIALLKKAIHSILDIDIEIEQRP